MKTALEPLTGFTIDSLLTGTVEELQLSPSRFREAEERYGSVSDWIAGSPVLSPFNPKFYPQGSMLLGTTVQPLRHAEFDVDLVCEFNADPRTINPVWVLDHFEQRLREHGVYKGMVERKNRCLRLTYANQFHIDITPACPAPGAATGCIVVPDDTAHAWKASAPKPFATWYQSRAAVVKLAALRDHAAEPLPQQVPSVRMLPLKVCTQLLKRNRDLSFAENISRAPISVVLTCLAAQSYAGQVSISDALTSLLLQLSEGLPRHAVYQVHNPGNPLELFSEKWVEDPSLYWKFLAWLDAFKSKWTEVVAAQGIHNISTKLGELFGVEVTQRVVTMKTAEMEGRRNVGTLGVVGGSGHVTSVGNAGARPIPRNSFYGD